MKIVMYRVKENDLSIQSSSSAGARLGWLENSWIIDIGFTQQWLIYYRQLSDSFLLPMKLMQCLMSDEHSFVILSRMYRVILKEDWSKLVIHGEPISIPVDETQLLSPLLESDKLIVPPSLHSKNLSLHPSSILWPDLPIPNAQKFLPGVAFMVGRKKGESSLIACSLINYWLKEGEWIPSLGPYLLVTDDWKEFGDQWFIVRRNEQMIYQQQINLWHRFVTIREMYSESDHLSTGGIISTFFSSSAVDVGCGDCVEIEMACLGRLQNRVDKTGGIHT